jgi:transposase, IS605 OrfB family, central region
MKDDDWHVGTAEALVRHGREELHVTVTNETAEVSAKTTAETVVGVDINEDCVALAALTESGIEDSVVIDYPKIKEKRHRYFTMRKRMQEAGQTGFNDVFHDKEQRFVHDQLHTVSRRVVEWIQRFDTPVIVFEDLKDIRDDIEYGTQMNRRLHSLPFAKLRDFISYKAAWWGIPSDDVDPEYTSQQCPLCGHTERANRHKKRFTVVGAIIKTTPTVALVSVSHRNGCESKTIEMCLLSTHSHRYKNGSCDGRHRGL